MNFRKILQNHIFTNTEQKYMMLLPFERGMFAVSYWPKRTPTSSVGWSCSGHKQHFLHLATSVTRPDSVWFLPVWFRQGQCLRSTTSKDITRIAKAHQHRNRECHTHKTCLRGFGVKGSIDWTSVVSHEGHTSNAFKVNMKLQKFFFQMIVTSCISVQYLWNYVFAKSSDNLYSPCSYKSP